MSPIALRLLLVALLLSNTCRADPPSPPSPWRPDPIPAGEDVIAPIYKGDPAPYDGVVFDLNSAKRWAGYLQQAKDTIARERAEHDRLMAVELRRVRETQQLALDVKNRELLQALTRVQELEKKVAQPTPFYQTAWFGASVATVLLAGGYLVLRLEARLLASGGHELSWIHAEQHRQDAHRMRLQTHLGEELLDGRFL